MTLRALRIVAGALLASALLAPAAGAQQQWRLEQPAPPEGAPFKVPLGAVGDLQFFQPNRGILAVEGNATIPRGLFLYDGVGWRQLATVCGGPADTLRVAWAGPREFWTVSEPSRPRIGSGITLCRFKDGRVVASYGTPAQSADAYQPMNSAHCVSANDCWFGGAAADPSTGRRGAFRLRWDGTGVVASYGPQGRGISDVQSTSAGEVYESAVAGPAINVRGPVENRLFEDRPKLLRKLGPDGFLPEPWDPTPRTGIPDDGYDLLALDGEGAQLWAGGGGATSGESAPEDGTAVPAGPLLVHRRGPGEPLRELPIGGLEQDRVVDVASLPGSSIAWAAVAAPADRRSTNVRAKVTVVNADTGFAETTRLPAAGSGRGAASRIACTTGNRCWLATTGGWLFHWSDGTPLARDTESGFDELITFRPNESAAQFVPDAPPVDDSQLLAPPPVEVTQTPAPAARVRRLRAALANVRKPTVKGRTLTLRFSVRRRVRVQLQGLRGSRVVARSKRRTLKPGRAKLTMRLSKRRSRYPTRLRFRVTELGSAGRDQSGDGDDLGTVST